MSIYDDLEPENDAEKKLIEKAAKGEEADYRTGDEKKDDPAKGAEWGEERTVRGEIICALLTGARDDWPITHRGVGVRGAKVVGTMDLTFAELIAPLLLGNSYLEQPIKMLKARAKSLVIAGTYFRGLIADGLRVSGDIFLRPGCVSKGEVNFRGAEIDGAFECTGGSFENPNGHALNLDQLSVNGGVFLNDGFSAKGEVRLLGAKIGGNLECDGGMFENNQGPALEANRLTVKGDVFLRRGFSAKGEVVLRGAKIGGNLECSGGKFEYNQGPALNANRLTVKGSAFFDSGFSAKGEVRLVGAEIGGNLVCIGGTFENSEGVAISASQLSVEESVFLDRGFSSNGKLDFQHANVGVLADDRDCWPKQDHLLLDGFVYEAIAPNSPTAAKDRLEWLGRQPERPFRPQPYEQLVKVLREMGHESDAREIAIAKQEALRERGDLSRPAKAWNRFLGVLIGHGYRPWKVLPHIAVMVALGFITFSIADQNAMMRPAKERVYMNPCFSKLTEECMQDGWVQIPKLLYLRPGVRLWGPGINLPRDYPRFHPGLYSADVFFPFVDLHQEGYWLPRAEKSGENFYRIYMWLHILLGWLLTSIGVVGLTGIVKKD